MKKLLAMVLALVMTLSLAVSANAAFEDAKDINDTYAEAVDVLAGMKVFQGYDNGKTFKPQGDITRAEVAAIVYRISTGDVTDKQAGMYASYNKFNDMNGAGWAAGYIGYCANAELVKGYPDGTFKPSGKVTGYEVLAMILRAVGYDKQGEFSGAAWQLHVAEIAQKNGILDNVKGVDLNKAASRELVAELLFQAINVPMVTYTAAFGYQNVSLTADKDKNLLAENETLGHKTFGLAKVSGEIVAVSYLDKTTTFNADEKYASKEDAVVTGVDAGFENIGYEGYVWAVPGAKKTTAAVSAVYVTGESLGNSTDKTTYDKLTKETDDAYIAADAARVYYNGNPVTSENDISKYEELVGKVGVKVDFIDNDNNGKTDVVVITDYNVAKVAGIVKDNTIGTNAVEKDKYYFHDEAVTGSKGSFTKVTGVKESALVCDDELAVNDLVTYVEYNDAYYVVKAPLTTETFTRINYAKVGGDVTSYVIGGVEYIISGKDVSNAVKTLVKENLNKKFDVMTDPYGHIIYADLSTADVDYLYVLANNHTTGISKLTDTEVVFSDGSVKTIAVKEIKAAPEAIADEYKTGKTFDVNEIANHIYTYTENTNGSYTLTPAHDGELNKVDYETKTAQWGELGVNLSTKVIDLRDEDKVEVYTGYNEIPSLTDAEVCYVKNDKGYITLAYLYDGKNTEDLKANLIVYKTGHSGTEKIDGEYVYYLDVISDDKAVEGYKLTQKQYNAILDLGVGEYYFNAKGDLKEFIAFPETWSEAEWSDGAIKVNGSYKTLGDEISYNVINVTKGEVVEITRNTMGSIILENAEKDVHAYAKYNEAGTAVEKLYIVIGDEAKDGTVANYTKGENKYLVKDGKVTTFTKNTELVASDYLESAKLNTVEAKLTGGKGTDKAPFTYVATGCVDCLGDNFQNLVVVAKNGMTVKAYYPDDLVNAKGESIANVLSYTDDTYKLSQNPHFVFVITSKGTNVYFDLTFNPLNHGTALKSSNAQVEVAESGDKITVDPEFGDYSTLTFDMLKSVLSAKDGSKCVLTSYARTEGKTEGQLVVTAECGHTVTYTVEFKAVATNN